MVLASIHIIHNTVQNYLPFWILVYRAVPWYTPPVQYQLCIYVCYNTQTQFRRRISVLFLFHTIFTTIVHCDVILNIVGVYVYFSTQKRNVLFIYCGPTRNLLYRFLIVTRIPANNLIINNL